MRERKLLRNILLIVIVLIMLASAAFAEGLSGWAMLNYGGSETRTDGSVEQTSDFWSRYAYLQLDRPVTPLLSYRLSVRGTSSDTDVKNENGEKTTQYLRIIEPAGDIFFTNPIYSASAGFRHQELWTTARLDAENMTENNYYARLAVKPYKLPTLNLDYDRKDRNSTVPGQEVEETNKRYSGTSSYGIEYGGLKGDFYASYSHIEDDRPQNIIQRDETDQWNGQYHFQYTGAALENRATYRASYRANYLQQTLKRFSQPSSVPQAIVNQRVALDGLIAQGTFVQPEVTPLNSLGALIDGNVNAGIPAINIGTQSYYNIGIRVIQGNSVDRLYLYVDRDVSSDVNLRNPSNWRILVSDSNLISSVWTSISIARVDVTAVDVLNEIYRYELIFDTPQDMTFYKAVNLATVSVLGVSDVLVTEIEAWGTDSLPPSGVSKTEDKFYRQEIILNGGLRMGRVTLSVASLLNQEDIDYTVLRSTGNIFENYFNKSFYDGGQGYKSTIYRNYTVSVSWLARRDLTAGIRYGRSDRYDSDDTTDEASNTYELFFLGTPLPTLSTNLTFAQRDTFSFGYRSVTERTAILTVGARLLKDADLVTDIGYRNTESRTSDTTENLFYLAGSLNAMLTTQLSSYLTYNFDFVDGNSGTTDSNAQKLHLVYQPGKFITMSFNIRHSYSGGTRDLSEGINLDWLPLRTIRLTLFYDHRETDPGNRQRDSSTAQVTWFINPYFDLRVDSGYIVDKALEETKQMNFQISLTARL